MSRKSSTFLQFFHMGFLRAFSLVYYSKLFVGLLPFLLIFYNSNCITIATIVRNCKLVASPVLNADYLVHFHIKYFRDNRSNVFHAFHPPFMSTLIIAIVGVFSNIPVTKNGEKLPNMSTFVDVYCWLFFFAVKKFFV